MTIDWDKYNDFEKWEFDCSHSSHNKMDERFMDTLQTIRSIYGKVMVVNSGYRCRTHPLEAIKKNPGEHSHGLAADIAVRGVDVLHLEVIAYGQGIRRMGRYQNDNQHFIHIGMGDQFMNFPEAVWTP